MDLAEPNCGLSLVGIAVVAEAAGSAHFPVQVVDRLLNAFQLLAVGLVRLADVLAGGLDLLDQLRQPRT
jgi:hypothetical protein